MVGIVDVFEDLSTTGAAAWRAALLKEREEAGVAASRGGPAQKRETGVPPFRGPVRVSGLANGGWRRSAVAVTREREGKS